MKETILLIQTRHVVSEIKCGLRWIWSFKCSMLSLYFIAKLEIRILLTDFQMFLLTLARRMCMVIPFCSLTEWWREKPRWGCLANRATSVFVVGTSFTTEETGKNRLIVSRLCSKKKMNQLPPSQTFIHPTVLCRLTTVPQSLCSPSVSPAHYLSLTPWVIFCRAIFWQTVTKHC